MQDIDTEKLREILEIMVANGAVFFKHGETIIEFPREDGEAVTTQVVGFDAGGGEDSVPVEVEDRSREPRPVGYTALFGKNKPTFPRPHAEGTRA